MYWLRSPAWLGLLAFWPANCVAGAFLLPPGEGLLIVTTSFEEATRSYDGAGRLTRAPSYKKFETRAYVEYGLFEQLTLVAETSHMHFRSASASRDLDRLAILTQEARAGAPLVLPDTSSDARYAGVGSGWLGARLRLLQLGSAVVSVQASLRAATPSAQKFLDMKRRLQHDARLQYGLPFRLFGFDGFGEAQIGFRSDGQSGGEIRADFTCGVRPIESLLLLAQSFAVVAPGGRSISMASQKFQLSAVYDLTRDISLQIGGLAAVQGVNASAERGVIGAVWYRF
jgi:hypothetical protein